MKTILQAPPFPLSNVRQILCALLLGGLAVLLPGCSGPPPGPDLVETTCVCTDQCNAGAKLRLGGVVCTDASKPETAVRSPLS